MSPASDEWWFVMLEKENTWVLDLWVSVFYFNIFIFSFITISLTIINNKKQMTYIDKSKNIHMFYGMFLLVTASISMKANANCTFYNSLRESNPNVISCSLMLLGSSSSSSYIFFFLSFLYIFNHFSFMKS